MKLWAIGDLHLANRANRDALRELPARPDDWLILAGDVGETELHLRYALEVLCPRFARLLWVPGNHDLWTLADDPIPLRGEAKYRRLVEVCREYRVLTPEDPYPRWPGRSSDTPAAGEHPGDSPDYVIAPLFLLYDYSFRPPQVAAARAVDWAAESGVICSDEHLLHPAPHASRQAWCEARLLSTEPRLERASAGGRRLVLINHWPLREDLVNLYRIPRFSIWCGTRATEDWHRRFNAVVVIHGHLHIKATHFRDGVRFEEVSLGYPRDWDRARGVDFYLRQILPLPETPLSETRRATAGSAR